MKQLTRIVLVINSFLGLMTLAAILGGRAIGTSKSLEQVGFDLCNGEPCFRGIVPGTTTWPQIEAKLGKKVWHNIANHYYEIGQQYFDSSVSLWVVSRDNEKSANSVSARFVDYSLTVGEVVARYGAPCSVNFEQGYMVLIYPKVQIEAGRVEGVFPNFRYIHNPVEMILLHYQPELCLRFNEPNYKDSYFPWLGFTAYERYIALFAH